MREQCVPGPFVGRGWVRSLGGGGGGGGDRPWDLPMPTPSLQFELCSLGALSMGNQIAVSLGHGITTLHAGSPCSVSACMDFQVLAVGGRRGATPGFASSGTSTSIIRKPLYSGHVF